jgi:uncharacterized protein (DUF427 family)
METKSIKLPGPNHPITIGANPARVTVSVAGRIIADTRNALTLREASYAAVQYIPQKDVDMTLLKRTDRHTYCPYKGDCAYYSIPLGGDGSVNAVWTYENPYAAVAAIKDHVAFYPVVRSSFDKPHAVPMAVKAMHSRGIDADKIARDCIVMRASSGNVDRGNDIALGFVIHAIAIRANSDIRSADAQRRRALLSAGDIGSDVIPRDNVRCRTKFNTQACVA